MQHTDLRLARGAPDEAALAVPEGSLWRGEGLQNYSCKQLAQGQKSITLSCIDLPNYQNHYQRGMTNIREFLCISSSQAISLDY